MLIRANKHISKILTGFIISRWGLQTILLGVMFDLWLYFVVWLEVLTVVEYSVMSEFIEKQKKLYKKLKSCFCPALQADVHFTSDGLHHLLYHRRRPRSQDERHYRAALIRHLAHVIQNSTQAIKEVRNNNPLIVVWELKHGISGQGLVKVIVKQEGTGKLKFLSAMAKKKTKKPRAKPWVLQRCLPPA